MDDGLGGSTCTFLEAMGPENRLLDVRVRLSDDVCLNLEGTYLAGNGGRVTPQRVSFEG